MLTKITNKLYKLKNDKFPKPKSLLLLISFFLIWLFSSLKIYNLFTYVNLNQIITITILLIFQLFMIFTLYKLYNFYKQNKK